MKSEELKDAIDYFKNKLESEVYGAKYNKIAIEVLSKYQKIEDIYYHQTGFALEDSLREVVEDGKR